jgi:hypothetical protein
MLATPGDDPQAIGEVVHDVVRGDLDAKFVQLRFRLEAFNENVETFLPGGFAEVAGSRSITSAGSINGLGDEAVTVESVRAHRRNLTLDAPKESDRK